MATKIENKRILIIDDDDDCLELFSYFVKSFGFDTKTFNNPLEALNELRFFDNYHLVVVDYSMPFLNGVEFQRQRILQNIATYIPTILLSGYDNKYPEFDGWLSKPINVENFKNLLLTLTTHPIRRPKIRSQINSYVLNS